MHAQQVPVSCLYNVFLGIVIAPRAELGAIARGGDVTVERFLLRPGLSRRWRREAIEDPLRGVVTETDDGLGWETVSDGRAGT